MDFYRYPARDLRRLEAISKSPLNSQFSEVLRGATTIKAFSKTAQFRNRHLELSEMNTRVYWVKWAANQWITVWLELIGCVMTLAAGAFVVWTSVQGSLSGGDAGLILTYTSLVPNQLMWLLKNYSQVCFMYTCVSI